MGKLAAKAVRLDRSDARSRLAHLQVLDLDEAVLGDRVRERPDQLLLVVRGRRRLGGLVQLELPKGLLELLADAVEPRVSLGRDHGADELEREPDGACLERRQSGGPPEGVAEELFLDVHRVTLDRRIEGVAAAPEVDEIEELEVLVEMIDRNAEPLRKLGGGDIGRGILAAAGKEMCQERLQEPEALRGHRADGPLDHLSSFPGCLLLGRLGRRPLMGCDHALDGSLHELDELGRLQGACSPFLVQDPGGEPAEAGVLGHEHVPVDTAAVGEGALDEPGEVLGQLDPRLARDLTDLPRRAASVDGSVELLRNTKVTLAAGGEPDVGSDAGDTEGSLLFPVVIPPDHVPGAGVREEGVRVDRPLRLLVPLHREIAELHRPALRDRALELREPPRHLLRVVRVVDLHGRLPAGLERGRPAECEILEREPKRLGIGEAPVEEMERRLQRCQLVVLEIEGREEVLLGAQRVELFPGELVPLGMEWHAERDQLAPVGVEAPCKGLVGHLRVPLDVGLHVSRGDRPTLRHEVGDERKLPDELVGVVRHGS